MNIIINQLYSLSLSLSLSSDTITTNSQRQGLFISGVLMVATAMPLSILQALIKFKNYFYFEEKDETLEEHEKVMAKMKWKKNDFYFFLSLPLVSKASRRK